MFFRKAGNRCPVTWRHILKICVLSNVSFLHDDYAYAVTASYTSPFAPFYLLHCAVSI